MKDQRPVGLTVRAAYDPEAEAVGLDVEPTDAFAEVSDIKAVVEILAACVAKCNFMTAEAIRVWDGTEQRKQEAFDHYAALKENMLQDLLDQASGQRD